MSRRCLRVASLGAIATVALLVPSSALAQIDSLALSAARLKSDGNLVVTLTIQCQPPRVFDFGYIAVRQGRGRKEAKASGNLSDDFFEMPCTGSVQNLDITLKRSGSVELQPGEATATADVDVFNPTTRAFDGRTAGPVSLRIQAASPPSKPARTGPKVSMKVRPRNGCVSSAVKVTAKATGDAKLSRLVLSLDGKRLVRTKRRRFHVRVRVRGLDPSVHRLKAVALGKAGGRAVKVRTFRRCAAPNFTG